MTHSSQRYILLSKKGMKELRKRIARLEHEQSQARLSLRELDKGTGHEDRLERAERLSNLETIESELSDKREVLARAQIISSPRTRLEVAIGSVVDLIDQQGRLLSYTIVDSIEANPSDGRISAESPLGSSLIGKAVKDTIAWGNGLKQHSFQLVGIR